MPSDAVLQVIEERRQEIRDNAAWAIATIEARRDYDLDQLDLEGDGRISQPEAQAERKPKPAPKPPSRPRPKPKRKSHKPGTSSPVAAAERCDKIHGYLHQQGGLVASKEIRAAVDVSETAFRTATKRLVKEGKIRREGDRQFTRYESIQPPAGATTTTSTGTGPAPRSGPPAPATAGGGTLQGQLLSRVVGLGGQGQSEAELAEFAGITREEVRSTMGKLIAEEEVELKRRDGVSVYVPGRAL